jgi:hypothetical protein
MMKYLAMEAAILMGVAAIVISVYVTVEVILSFWP